MISLAFYSDADWTLPRTDEDPFLRYLRYSYVPLPGDAQGLWRRLCSWW